MASSVTAPIASSSVPHSSQPAANSLSPASIFNVEGLIVVVTGGGTGIGLQIAIALESNGATVYIVGRRRHVLEKAAGENNKFNRIIPLEGDITSRASLLRIVDTVKARHGYIDLLINNAGIARNLLAHPLPSPDGTSAPSIKDFQAALWDTGSPADFATTFETNVTAVYYTTVAFLDLLHQGNLRQQRRTPSTNPLSPSVPPHHASQVLSVSSSGSFRVDAKVLSVSYTLAKTSCTQLGKLLANLLAPWGIRSNVLAPGVWPSEMTSDTTGGVHMNPNDLASVVPLRRTGTQEDTAGIILFLASRAGAYLNGAVWLIDGGRVGSVASSY